MRVRVLYAWSLVAAVSFSSAGARAGGFEYIGAGTRAAGRGGAFSVRADDPMALELNPANLAALNTPQVLLNVNAAMMDACYQRTAELMEGFGDYGSVARNTMPGSAGRFDDEDGNWISANFPRVCNNVVPSPGVSLAFSVPVLPNELTISAGFMTPYAIAASSFGNPDGTATLATPYRTVDGARLPSPARYTLNDQSILQFFPTVGFGWAPTSWLRIGGAFQWGMTIISYTNHAATAGGESFSQDFRPTVSAQDLFQPGFIASVHVIPDERLEAMVGFRYTDAVRADATIDLRANTFNASGDPMAPPITTRVTGAQLTVGQPMRVWGGLRYGHKRDGASSGLAPGRLSDRMWTELFDLEFNAVYEINRVVDDFVVNLPAGASVITQTSPEVRIPLPTTIVRPHRWNDQVSVRLGGDWNVIPGQLAVRAGGYYESSGIDARYAQLDFMPGQRVGLSLGATLRVDRFDLSAAYMHAFQETLTVPTSIAQLPQIVGTSTPSIVNAGTYWADWNIVSLGANYHFE